MKVLAAVFSPVLALLRWTFSRPIRALTKTKNSITRDHGIEITVAVTEADLRKYDLAGLLDCEPEWLTGMFHYFPSGEIPPEKPSRNESWATWAQRHGGEDTYASHVLILFQPSADGSFAVFPPAVTNKKWNINPGIICGPAGAGGNGLQVRSFVIDLDVDPPTVHYFDNQGREKSSATVNLAKGETLAIVAITRTLRGRNEWRLEIPVLASGVKHELRVDNNGKPFVTVGREGIATKLWDADRQRWLDARPNAWEGRD